MKKNHQKNGSTSKILLFKNNRKMRCYTRFVFFYHLNKWTFGVRLTRMSFLEYEVFIEYFWSKLNYLK